MQTPDRIKALATEAAQAGDLEQVALCERALAGDAAALTECERVLARAAAQADDSERETTVRIRAEQYEDCLTAAAAALRDEALLAGDIAMAVICEVASDGPETFRDDARYLALPHSERSELERLTRDEARAKVVAAIHNAEAQS